MSLSIITPHFNDFYGLKEIYTCLQKQSSEQWEWIVVDDYSDFLCQQNIKNWFDGLNDDRVHLIFSTTKGNASICRNKGAVSSRYTSLVFLDSDDFISDHFVVNRDIEFKDFAVFGNYQIVNEKGKIQRKYFVKKGNHLNQFLSAQFLWQTTCILWDKDFFNRIGQFDPQLVRLQDVALSIRALQSSTDFSIVDNDVDFYYKVKPIRERKHFVKPVCDAVYLFISELLNTKTLSMHQRSLLSGYYYTCARYLERSGNITDLRLVQRNLRLFYTKGYIKPHEYSLGYFVLKIYKRHWLSGKQFLRINRYLFKPRNV